MEEGCETETDEKNRDPYGIDAVKLEYYDRNNWSTSWNRSCNRSVDRIRYKFKLLSTESVTTDPVKVGNRTHGGTQTPTTVWTYPYSNIQVTFTTDRSKTSATDNYQGFTISLECC